MELPGSSLQSSGVVMELTGSCHGVVWMFPLSLGFLCHGVAFHCHGVDWELTGSCPLSAGVVMELTRSCPLSLGVAMELT